LRNMLVRKWVLSLALVAKKCGLAQTLTLEDWVRLAQAAPSSLTRSVGSGCATRSFTPALRRPRPILMTALATIFGMLPLAIGVGSGAQLLQPLAIAVIGGVLVSMILSLLTTPALFFVLRERGR
jgi:Cu/Ag efflux pump CusA